MDGFNFGKPTIFICFVFSDFNTRWRVGRWCSIHDTISYSNLSISTFNIHRLPFMFSSGQSATRHHYFFNLLASTYVTFWIWTVWFRKKSSKSSKTCSLTESIIIHKEFCCHVPFLIRILEEFWLPISRLVRSLYQLSLLWAVFHPL